MPIHVGERWLYLCMVYFSVIYLVRFRVLVYIFNFVVNLAIHFILFVRSVSYVQ